MTSVRLEPAAPRSRVKHLTIEQMRSLTLVLIDDFLASYKFRSLNHFLTRGDFKPLNEGSQTNKRQISKRAVLQTCQSIRE